MPATNTTQPTGADDGRDGELQDKLVYHIYTTYGEVKAGSIDHIMQLIYADREAAVTAAIAAYEKKRNKTVEYKPDFEATNQTGDIE